MTGPSHFCTPCKVGTDCPFVLDTHSVDVCRTNSFRDERWRLLVELKVDMFTPHCKNLNSLNSRLYPVSAAPIWSSWCCPQGISTREPAQSADPMANTITRGDKPSFISDQVSVSCQHPENSGSLNFNTATTSSTLHISWESVFWQGWVIKSWLVLRTFWIYHFGVLIVDIIRNAFFESVEWAFSRMLSTVSHPFSFLY